MSSSSSCSECQRRKQKCNREWPCNHCQARKVSHLCQFGAKKATADGGFTIGKSVSQKGKENDFELVQETPINRGIPLIYRDDEFKTMGYMHGYQHFELGDSDDRSTNQTQIGKSEGAGCILQGVLPRPYTDSLVQNFLDGGNYHYYALYPPAFVHQYNQWWVDRVGGRRPSVEMSCLLLRVCACSTQYLNARIRQNLECELGENAHVLTERFHYQAQELSRTILPGTGGLVQVQQLFLTASWFKSQARFVESWHALSHAIREAQELGMHNHSRSVELTEFDREMRSRIWCLLYTWDWFMSTLLSRPLIINHNACSFELPNLRLEYSTTKPDLPSPFTQMALQCQLVQKLSKGFGLIDGALPPPDIFSFQKIIENWIASLPPVYSMIEPDRRWDDEYPYIILHRQQLHAIGYATMLSPLKPYLTKSVSPTTPEVDNSLRAAGVNCCLRLMEVSQHLFHTVFPINAKFHLVIFCIFDAAAVLCSAIIHDDYHTLPQRDNIVEAIGLAVNLLERLDQATKTGGVAHGILMKLVGRLPISSQERRLLDAGFCEMLKTTSPPQDPQSQNEHSRSNTSSAVTFPAVGLPHVLPNATDLQFSEVSSFQPMDFNDLTDMNVDGLGQIWDWGTLNLGLPGSTAACSLPPDFV